MILNNDTYVVFCYDKNDKSLELYVIKIYKNTGK